MKWFREMTDAELEREFNKWDEKIKNAKQWGAAITAADEFREDARREIARRLYTVKGA